MEKIRAITEAFSMQPETYSITTLDAYNKRKEQGYYGYENMIKEIKHESIQVSGGGPEMYYVGYNFEGKKLFQFLANTINVHFEVE